MYGSRLGKHKHLNACASTAIVSQVHTSPFKRTVDLIRISTQSQDPRYRLDNYANSDIRKEKLYACGGTVRSCARARFSSLMLLDDRPCISA